MVYDPILDLPLEVLNLLPLPFYRLLIARFCLQKIDEIELPRFDLLPQLLEPGMEPVPFGIQLLELVRRQIELKKKRPFGRLRLMHSSEQGQLVSDISSDKNQVQGNRGDEQ